MPIIFDKRPIGSNLPRKKKLLWEARLVPEKKAALRDYDRLYLECWFPAYLSSIKLASKMALISYSSAIDRLFPTAPGRLGGKKCRAAVPKPQPPSHIYKRLGFASPTPSSTAPNNNEAKQTQALHPHCYPSLSLVVGACLLGYPQQKKMRIMGEILDAALPHFRGKKKQRGCGKKNKSMSRILDGRAIGMTLPTQQ